jgi:hypothetical protein
MRLIEAAMLALVVMYSMYLLVTGGKSSTTRRICRKADGSCESEETVTYADPRSWIAGVIDLVGTPPLGHQTEHEREAPEEQAGEGPS